MIPIFFTLTGFLSRSRTVGTTFVLAGAVEDRVVIGTQYCMESLAINWVTHTRNLSFERVLALNKK